MKYLIIIGILITPFLNLGEVLALIKGDIESQSVLYTPIYIKVLKDIVMILIISALIIKHLMGSTIKFHLILLMTILLIVINIKNSVLFGSSEYVIYGLRWVYPLFIFLLLFNKFDDFYLDKKFTFSLFLIFVIHFIFQIYQLFYAIPWFGSIGSLNLRNPGLFLIPNTGAFFSTIVLYWLLFYLNINKLSKFFMAVIIFLSVTLTLSGTGIAVASFIVLVYLIPKRSLFLFLLVAPLVLIAVLEILDKLRGGYIEVSGGTRIMILKDILQTLPVLSDKFGYYTNTASLLGDGLIVDSTYASIAGNLGLFVFAIVVIFSFYLFIDALIKGDKKKLAFMTIIISFSTTTIILEAYPMNLLLSLIGCKVYSLKSYTSKNLLNTGGRQ